MGTKLELLRKREVLARLGKSESFLKRLIKDNDGPPHIKIGSENYWHAGWLERWMAGDRRVQGLQIDAFPQVPIPAPLIKPTEVNCIPRAVATWKARELYWRASLVLADPLEGLQSYSDECKVVDVDPTINPETLATNVERKAYFLACSARDRLICHLVEKIMMEAGLTLSRADFGPWTVAWHLGPVDEVPDPKADRCDENEAKIAVGGFVVSGGQSAAVL